MTHQRLAFTDPDLIAEVTHPRLRDLLADLDGFDEILESARNVARPFSPLPSADTTQFVARIIQGENPDAVLAEFVEARAHADAHERARDLLSEQARATHDRRLAEFIRTHRADIATELVRRLEALIAEVKPLLPELTHVTASDDLADHPDAAPAWARLTQLAREFDSWREWGRYYFALPAGPWPDAEVIANLDQIAPDYWQHPERASLWPDTRHMLRALAHTNARMWAPTATELDQKRAHLTKLAHESRAEQTAQS